MSEAFVRGHELHAIVLAPTSRLSAPSQLANTLFAGRPAMVIEFTDTMNEPVRLYYAVSDTLPLGLQVTWLDPDVWVTLDGWERRDGLLLFTRAEFRQGNEVFRYTYVEVSINDVDDAVFRWPASIDSTTWLLGSVDRP